jgi:hypothetical protein
MISRPARRVILKVIASLTTDSGSHGRASRDRWSLPCLPRRGPRGARPHLPDEGRRHPPFPGPGSSPWCLQEACHPRPPRCRLSLCPSGLAYDHSTELPVSMRPDPLGSRIARISHGLLVLVLVIDGSRMARPGPRRQGSWRDRGALRKRIEGRKLISSPRNDSPDFCLGEYLPPEPPALTGDLATIDAKPSGLHARPDLHDFAPGAWPLLRVSS